MTGKGIANLILENLQQFGINTQYLRGQGYDGAAAMARKCNGVQVTLKKFTQMLYMFIVQPTR
jgi:hypothetical protein